MSRPGSNKANSKAIESAERQAEAVKLRKAGCTYVEIAQKLGYKGHQGARQAVLSALKKTVTEPTKELITLESERLDVMLRSLWPKVLKGEPRAVEVALKIGDRRAALLGLDAPKQQDLTVGGSLQREYIVVMPEPDEVPT